MIALPGRSGRHSEELEEPGPRLELSKLANHLPFPNVDFSSPHLCSSSSKFKGKVYEAGLRKSQALNTHTNASPKERALLPGHRPWALGAEGHLHQGRDKTYLHGDSRCQGCPGP